MKESKARPDFVEEVRGELYDLAGRAGKLAENLGRTGEPLSRQDKEVVGMAADAKIRRLMEEATYFLLADYVDDAKNDFRTAKEWAIFKREI